MKRETTELGSLVVLALEMAIQHEQPFRLIKSGQKPGLFPSSRAQATTAAIATSRNPDLNLLTFTVQDEKRGRLIEKVEYAAITREGIQLLFDTYTPERRLMLLEKCANPYKESAFDIHIGLTRKEIDKADAEMAVLEQRAFQLRTTLVATIKEQLAKIDISRSQLEVQQKVLLGAIEEDFNPINSKESTPSPPRLILPQPPSAGRPPLPSTEADLDFQMHVCRELVFAWQDTSDSELRASFEPAMLNVGLESVGEIGQIVSFDNRDHQTNDDLKPGDPAKIIEHGWKLTSSRGTRLIAPIQVVQSLNGKGTVDAAHVEH